MERGKFWRKLTTGLLTMMLAVFLLPTGLQYAFAADPQTTADAPAFSKHLKDNGDGTYTLSLSVTGTKSSESIENVSKANVILVIDTSSSMNNNAAAGNEQDPHIYYTVPGTPGNPDNEGVDAVYFRKDGDNYREVYYNPENGRWYQTRGGNQWTGYTYSDPFSGQFYARSRFWAEYHALTDDGGIVDSLLAQNTTVNPDIIEIGIASFGGKGVTNLDFSGNSNTNAAAIKNVISGLTQSQGTNWEEGLQEAHNIYNTLSAAEKSDEKTYVIFLTDGQPTTHHNSYDVSQDLSAEFDAAKDDARTLVNNDKAEFYGLYTWGNNNDYWKCVQSIVGYAYTGTGNYNTGDQGKTDHVFNATSTASLIEALKQIASTITNSVGYTDTGIQDGLTSMTHSNIKATTSGTITGLKYYRGGGDYGTVDLDNGVYGSEWADAPEASFAGGELDWQLGRNFELEDGVTYTVTFVVWPDQDSFDLVADLNNGVKSYDSLTPDEKSQIEGSPGSYRLKTNTEYPTVSYRTFTEKKNDQGEVIERIESEVKHSEIPNPDPVQLAEHKLNAKKEWEDSLDPSQREDVGDVELNLLIDGKQYYDTAVTLTEESKWTETGYIAIAPGLMVTDDSPAYDPDATHVTWGGETYAIIEPGHEYVFRETDGDKHFELTAYTHHPMIMGENSDGTLHVVDVVFTKDASGNITGIESVSELGDSLSATNSLKGGINISKKVVEGEGQDETEIEDLNPFTVTVTVTDPEGNALPTKTEDGTEYTIDYRIYYGKNNPKYGTENVTADLPGGRSGHIYKTGKSFDETIYVGDVIRVVNVESGSLYSVSETAPSGYKNVRTDYWYTEGNSSTKKNFTGAPTVELNTANYAEVVNKLTYGSLEVSKTVAVEDGSGLTIDKDKEFTFTFKLFEDALKTKELTNYKFKYTKTPAEGEAETGTIAEGGTFTLKHGEKFLIDKLPEGTYYEVTETAVAGYTPDPPNRIHQGAVVKDTKREAEFKNTYTVDPVSVDPQVQKEIKGNESLYNKGDFTFEIANTAAPEGVTVPMPSKTSITNIKANEVEGKTNFYEFGEITFTVPGTYKYTVTESGSVPGVTNDEQATKELTFTVTDNGRGQLVVTPTTGEAVFAFTNVYKDGELDITKTVVNGESATLKEFTFTVTLTDAKGNELTGSYPYTVYEDGEATETTGTISSGGTLKLKDKQTAKITKIPDGASYEVEESDVTDQGFVTTPASGKASGTINADEVQTAAFTNEYSPEAITVNFPVKKEVSVPEGQTGPADWTYTINVKANGTAPEADEMSGTVTKASPTTTFGPFEFTEAGTYTYTVTESGTVPGVTNDTEAEKTVTVTVTDSGTGELTAEVSSTAASPVTFVNPYDAGSIEVNFPVKKEVSVPEGMTGPADWTYTINVEANGTAPEADEMSGTVTKASPMTTFGPFEFKAPGTYTYTVTESGTVPGVTNDTEAEKTVTVTVTEVDGELTAEVSSTEASPVTFVNPYDIPGYVEVSIPVEKEMVVPTGMTGLDDWSYDISVAAKNSASPVAEAMTGVVTKAEPTTTFGPFTFTKADIGTHTYTVTESGTYTGVDNDEESEKEVTITIGDNGDGTLSVTKSFENASVKFTNTYCPGPVKTKIGVKKIIDSIFSSEDAINKEFTFTLTPIDGAPMPEGEEEKATVTIKTVDGVGEKFFNEIEYTEMNTYKYKLVEEGITNPGPGWTYDTGSETKEHEVTVVVADGGNGKLVATVSGGGSAVIVDGEDTGDTEVDITNEYVITGVETKLTLEKVVKDLSNSKPDGTFTFTLHERDGQTIGDQIGDEQTITVVDGVPQNTVTFEGDAFHYDEPGTYEYAVVESTDITEPGWSYDTGKTKNHFYTVVVDPDFEKAELYVDDEDSTLAASIQNTYEAEATNADIVVKKIIEDNSDDSGSRKYDRVFTFTLTPGDNDVPGDYATPMPPAGNEITITGEGEAAFEKIPFEKCGEYNYSIKEVVRDGDGYICSTSTYDVVVTVVDESAKLVASVDYSQAGGTSEEESVHVVNYYDPEDAVVALIATKVVTDNTGSAPDETFEFELVDADGNVIETVSRENSGVVKFKEITYSKLGTYKYQIREVAGNTPGFTYDDSVYDVTVTVTDPGKSGVLKAEVTGNNPTFNNPYDVPPGKSSVTDQIEITKKLTGRDLKDGEFTFVLKDSDGKVVGVAKNDASGNVVFPKLTFRKVGSYTYTVYENPGEDADITYDKSIYTTTAVVTDPHTGKSLKVKWTCDEKKITFVNTYEPPEDPKKPKKPDTGDHNNLEGWLTLMALAGAGCGTMVYRRRRYNK